MSQITNENLSIFTQEIILLYHKFFFIVWKVLWMFASQYVQPNNKNDGDIITIYVELVRLTDNTINNRTGVNRQKVELTIKM